MILLDGKKRFIFILIFIFIDVALILGFLLIRDATNINKLEKEIDVISELSLDSNNFDRKIKTSGGYAIVEKSIKDRLSYFSTGMSEITTLVNDPKLSKVLSYDNYNGDGPEFRKSLTYLEESSSKFNIKVDELLEAMDDDNLRDYIYKKSDNKYYVSLYKKYMFNDDIMVNIKEAKDLLNKTKIRVNNIYDVSIDVLNFLSLYQENWKLEDGEIKFQTEELYNYYIGLISKVQVK